MRTRARRPSRLLPARRSAFPTSWADSVPSPTSPCLSSPHTDRVRETLPSRPGLNSVALLQLRAVNWSPAEDSPLGTPRGLDAHVGGGCLALPPPPPPPNSPEQWHFLSVDASSCGAGWECVDAGGEDQLSDATPGSAEEAAGSALHWRPPRMAERPGQVVKGHWAPPTLHGQHVPPSSELGPQGRGHGWAGAEEQALRSRAPPAPMVNSPHLAQGSGEALQEGGPLAPSSHLWSCRARVNCSRRQTPKGGRSGHRPVSSQRGRGPGRLSARTRAGPGWACPRTGLSVAPSSLQR